METFGELLNHYIRRLGISDAELARSLGVRRQTIFRWREGLTARPRRREDVLLLAEKLRLTNEEQDRLLLAAGFAPASLEMVQPQLSDELPGDASTPEVNAATRSATEIPFEAAPPEAEAISVITPPAMQRRPLLMIGLAAAVIVMLAGTWWGINRFRPAAPPLTVTPTAEMSVVNTPHSPTYGIEPAQADETLILVTEMVNYLPGPVGYNVAGRLKEGLEREVSTTALQNIRVEVWPEPINLRKYALQAGQSVSATLTIYGEYDAGRVVLNFVEPAAEDRIRQGMQLEVADLQELSAVINDLPAQVRSLALLILGQIYLSQDQIEPARQILERTRRNLQSEPDIDNQTWGTLYFYLGLAYANGPSPRLTDAIEAYSQALEARPNLHNARLNRSIAYSNRRQDNDLELALADADYLAKTVPNRADVFNNRALILMAMSGNERLAEAEADLQKALELNPKLVSALINRAIIHFRRGESVELWQADLAAALSLDENRPAAWNMLCWGYAVENQPDLALPNCEKAIALDPKPTYLDSRGLAHALNGDYNQAMADFQVYVDWLEKQSGQSWRTTMEQRQAWITALANHENPFTPTVLAALRGD